MAKVNYVKTKTWNIDSRSNTYHVLYLSDVLSPPSGATFLYNQITWTFTATSGATVVAQYAKSNGNSFKYTDYGSYSSSGSRVTVTWRGEGDNFNGSSSSQIHLYAYTDYIYTNGVYAPLYTSCSGSITFTVCWQKSVTVNQGDTITKEQFDAIGWSATKGSAISHSGQSGIIYASTYNNTNLVSTINSGSYSGGTA